MPLTGVERFDRLAVGTTAYAKWKAAMKTRGVTITESTLPAGTRAEYVSLTELVVDPKQFRYMDLLQESRHLAHIVRAVAAGIDLAPPVNRLKLGITEYDAYSYELSLARRYGFSEEYVAYLNQRRADYWFDVQKKVLRSPSARHQFRSLLGRPFDPAKDAIGRPGQ